MGTPVQLKADNKGSGLLAPASFRERYPPPWRIEAMPGGYKVVSANGFSLAWVYALDNEATRAASPNALRSAEALALAKAIVELA